MQATGLTPSGGHYRYKTAPESHRTSLATTTPRYHEAVRTLRTQPDGGAETLPSQISAPGHPASSPPRRQPTLPLGLDTGLRVFSPRRSRWRSARADSATRSWGQTRIPSTCSMLEVVSAPVLPAIEVGGLFRHRPGQAIARKAPRRLAPSGPSANVSPEATVDRSAAAPRVTALATRRAFVARTAIPILAPAAVEGRKPRLPVDDRKPVRLERGILLGSASKRFPLDQQAREDLGGACGIARPRHGWLRLASTRLP
jgi:hypothetical protein